MLRDKIESMRYIVLFCLILLLGYKGTAQDAGFQWVAAFGSNEPDFAWNTLVDDEGNSYTMGQFVETVDFDPGPDVFELDAGESVKVYILKLDSEGNFLWCKMIGNEFFSNIIDANFDLDGSIIGVGLFEGTYDFDPGPDEHLITSGGAKDYFMLKLNPEGEFITVQTIGEFSSEAGYELSIGTDGSVYVAGIFNGSADFDPGISEHILTTSGDDDVFIQKFDSDWNFQWVRSVGGSLEDGVNDIVVDSDNNVFVVGDFRGDADFDPGPDSYILTSSGGGDSFTLKLDADGNFEWCSHIGAEFGDIPYGCDLDSDENIYIVGQFRGSVDFDPGPDDEVIVSEVLGDAFLQKLTSEGEFIYVKTINTSGSDQYNDLHIDETDQLFLVGSFSETADFDPNAGVFNLTSNGSTDIFVQSISSDGNLIWVKTFGGEVNDTGDEIALGNDGSIYVSGKFRETVDFNPNFGVEERSSNGSSDVFTLKLSECTPDESTDLITACNSYTWIDGETYTEDNSTATWLLSNIFGCDSLVNLDLTIIELDNSVTVDGATLTSNDPDASYQWLNCSDGYSEIPTETGVSFTASEDGIYAVRVEQGDCVDTSECIAIEGVGIPKNNLGVISVYPNPSQGTVFIKGLKMENYDLTIYSVTGETILQKSISGQEFTELELSQGQYILMLVGDDRIRYIRIVIT